MDFATAKKEAAARSLATKKDQFVNLKEDSTHEVTTKAGTKPMVKFSNGQEVNIAPPAKPKVEKQKVKAAVPKKKTAPKKEVKTKTDKVMKPSAKKSGRVAVPKGKSTIMTAKQLRKEVLEGNTVFSATGKQIPCSLMAKNEPAKRLNVVVSGHAGSKEYHIVKK